MKKGLSTVIANILLVLLGLISISLLFTTINTLIEKTSEQIEMSPIECIEFQGNPPIKIQKACYNSQSEELEINLLKNTNVGVKNLDFIIQSKDETLIYGCGDCCRACDIVQSGTKNYYINTKRPESVSLRVFNCIISIEKVGTC
ncbi:MAG: hypothetical protein ABIB79_00565 [archaeon]